MLQMPFLARLPGVIPAGTVNDSQLCSNLDFAQTFLDYANASDAPDVSKMQGQSLRTILSGQTPEEWRDAIYYRYWMHLAHHNIPGHYGVRNDRYKLVFFHGLPLDASLGKGDFQPSTAGWELYDLQLDPQEINNVYEKPEYAPVVHLLKNRLLELKQKYGDHDEAYPELMRLRKKLW